MKWYKALAFQDQGLSGKREGFDALCHLFYNKFPRDAGFVKLSEEKSSSIRIIGVIPIPVQKEGCDVSVLPFLAWMRTAPGVISW